MHLTKSPILALSTAALLAALLAACAGAPATKPTAPAVQNPKVAGVESADKLLRKGDAAAAADSLGKLAAGNPDDPELKRLQASALASAGKLPEARSLLDGILSTNPQDVTTLVMATQIARFQDDTRGEKAYLDRALAAAPDAAAVQVAWGNYWLDLHEWPSAQAAFSKATSIDTKNADAYKGLGQALYRLAKYDDAEKALDIALALDPADAFTWSDRSKVRYQLGHFPESEADLGEAIARAPNAAWPYIDRARFRLDTNRFVEAQADLDAAIKAEPDYFLPYLYRATLFVKIGKDDAALADYDMVVKLQPDYWYAYESAGLCAFRLGRWQDAAARFQKALTSAPTHTEYAELATIALLRAGQSTDGRDLAAKVAARLDRSVEQTRWTILRLFQDQNDLTSDLETRFHDETNLDFRQEALFGLGEYWIIRGHPELGAKYLGMARDMKRQGTIQYSLVMSELARLDQPTSP